MNKKIFINQNFAFLWIGKIISQVGDKFYAIALAWWILQETNSPKLMGFFLLVSVLPQLVFGFFAGAIVDRVNRKKILIITDIIRGILVFFIVLLSMLHILMVWHVFIIGATLSFVTAFFEPAIQAIIPQVVTKEKLNEANSMNQMVNGVCTVLGPVLGASLVSWFGVTIVFLFNGISFLLSAIFENFVFVNADSNLKTTSNHVWNDLKEGIDFLKSKPDIIRIIMVIAIFHFFMGSLMVLLPFLSKLLNGSGIRNLGYLEAMLGVGLLLGSIYIRKKRNVRVKERYLILLIDFMGVCFLLISLLRFLDMKYVVPYLLVFVLIGGVISCGSVFWQSLIQLNTPVYMTGRVFSVSTLAGNVSLPVAYALFGILLTYCSVKLILVVCGCSLLLLSLLFSLYLKVRSINPYQRQNSVKE